MCPVSFSVLPVLTEPKRAAQEVPGQNSESTEEEEVDPPASAEWRPPVPLHRQELQRARQVERMKRYEQVISLRSLGLKPQAIASRVGKGERTIRRWLVSLLEPGDGARNRVTSMPM